MLGAPPEISEFGSWWVLAISQQPSIGYGWFIYYTGLRPKSKFWTIWNVCMCRTLGVETVVLHIFLKMGFFIIPGGAVPGMCTPKWNLRWYYDSWGSNEKMIYILVRVDMTHRKEVMKAYSQKGRNNDAFIIYMTSPRGPPPVGLWTMGRTPRSWVTEKKQIALPRSG